MPILIKDYNWRQTDELIIIIVPLKGVCLKNVDIFTSDSYLKIHSPPFLFEVCLWQPVVEADSSCTLTKEEAVFYLVKQKAETWPLLAAEISRQEAIQVKQRAIEEVHTRAASHKKDIAAKRNERQRTAVREQISLNTQEQELIKQTREQERATALAQMGWTRTQSSVKITELPPLETPALKKSDQEIWKKQSMGPVAGPRKAAQIAISFTPRVFPSPSRESMMAEEQEWLSKQAEARRRTGFVVEELRPEEQDPLWLCDKAQSFYDVGNYQGAVSAYTHALSLNNRLYEVYAGRATAQLALGNLRSAITDASKALDLLTPAVPQNAEARARCLLCRGSALASLGLRPEALGELKAAEGLRPNCPDIQAAISLLQTKPVPTVS